MRLPTQTLASRRQRGKRVYERQLQVYWTCLRCGADMRYTPAERATEQPSRLATGEQVCAILQIHAAPGAILTTYRCTACGAAQTRRHKTKFI